MNRGNGNGHSGSGAVYFYAEDDIESVILSGDESESVISDETNQDNVEEEKDEEDSQEEEEEEGEEEGEEGEEKDESQYDKETDEYYRFVVSVMCQNNESDQSGNDDGDDDEDYVPGSEPPKKDADYEDEDDDDGYYRVTRKEVIELVNAGVRELAKMPEVKSTTTISQEKRREDHDMTNIPLPVHNPSLGLLTTSSLHQSQHSQHSQQHHDNQYHQAIPSLLHPHQFHQHQHQHQLQHHHQLPPPPPFAHPFLPPQPLAPAIDPPPQNLGEDQKKNRLLSALIQKMFAGTGDEDLVVDDMPMNNIRKLVARQMTMSTQLVLQMLLMSDNSTEVDQQLTSSLLELSNLKDAGVRKTALLREQLESIKLFSSSTTSTPLVYMRQLSDSDSDDDDHDCEADHVPPEDCSRHNILTRRRTLAMESSSTLFNVKALSNVSELLQTIDAARKERNMRLPSDIFSSSTASTVPSTVPPSSAAASAASFSSSLLQENHLSDSTATTSQRTLLSTHANRKCLFPILKDLLENKIAPKFCERVWNCLLPTSSYPLGEEFAQTIDPTSLFQRSIFTPAEDDLLLRGMIMTSYESTSNATHTEGTDWEEVQRRFLPSKDKRLLQYRQIQLISCEENSKFQRYRELEMENKIHTSTRKWTREEEISLLKGFQIFGNKWHMVKLYFLPYKSRNEIRLRWMYMLKLWEKAELNLKAAVKLDGTLHKSTRNFLKSIQALNSHPSTKNSSSSTTTTTPSSVSQVYLPPSAPNPNLPTLLGRSNPIHSTHHPLPPPPMIHLPSMNDFPSRSSITTPPFRQSFPPDRRNNSATQTQRTHTLPPHAMLQSHPPPPLTGIANLTELEEEQVDEGVLLDSDDEAPNECEDEGNRDGGNGNGHDNCNSGVELVENRKRVQNKDEFSCPPAKRIHFTDPPPASASAPLPAPAPSSLSSSSSSSSSVSASGSVPCVGQSADGSSSQSLFASVMSQVNPM